MLRLELSNLLLFTKQLRGEVTQIPSFSDNFNRTIHLLDRNGFIRDWLITGAWIKPADDLEKLLLPIGNPFEKNGRWVLTNGPDIAPLKAEIFKLRPFVSNQSMPVVVEGGQVSWQAPGDTGHDSDTWKRVHTGTDGYVDWSHFSYTPEYRHSLMATHIEVDQPEWRKIIVESQGPVQVWLNGEMVLSTELFGYMQPLSHTIETLLPSGISSLIISQWQISLREVRHAVRVRIDGLPVRVVIPSPGADEYASEIAERELENIALIRWARTSDFIEFMGTSGLKVRIKERMTHGTGVPLTFKNGKAKIRVTDIRNVAKASEKEKNAIDGDVTATMLDTGEIFVELRLDSPGTPIFRTFRTAYVPEQVRTSVPKSNHEAWREEVISHVAENYPSSARALARLEKDPQYVVTSMELAPALSMINSRADCADFEAVGLVHILHRFPEVQWEKGLRESVKATLLAFKYWIEHPGLDAMCYFTENHQFVWHTAEHLIGDYFAKDAFVNAHQDGESHSEHGRKMALDWLKIKLEGGFSEYDSNAYLAIDTLALVSLIEFSSDKEIRQFSEALLDKLLLSLASNSWRGIHGAAHGRSYTTTLRSSRFEETAPIMWALWGMGALNLAVLPVTTLITSKKYKVPPMIIKVAHSLNKNWNGRQVYRGKYRFTSDLLERPYSSDLHVWRTSDGMLSSVQDYRSGLPGLQEHVWGATLSTEVQVFASYPASFSHATSVRPNAWAGHLVLPRVRQHKNVVMAIYPLSDQLLPNSTHLWFPTPWMDEFVHKGDWIVGRINNGFIAVATPGGFSPLRNGDTAFQEWLPNGRGALYVSVLGNKKDHSDFKTFVQKLSAPNFDEKNLAISWKYKHRFDLSWIGPFQIDGESAQLDGGLPEVPPKLDNPAVTLKSKESILLGSFGKEEMKIDIIKGKRLIPKSGV
ncbi:MAG: hypothetical protein QNK54_05015 [Candidatus Planktophila sp.]